MKVVAIIQARMGSTRLPGKVMRILGGRTVLAGVVERAKTARGIDEVIVATTTSAVDGVIETESARAGAAVYRGSEDDVLRRYYEAAREAAAEVVVRVTADCPLLDSQVVSAMLGRFLLLSRAGRRIDYLSNTLQRTWPRGLDAEVVGFPALETAHLEATEPAHREHVTAYIWERPHQFALEAYTGGPGHSELRWTLDTEDDWRFLTAVFGLLAKAGLPVTTENVLELIRARPELAQINAHVRQKDVRQ